MSQEYSSPGSSKEQQSNPRPTASHSARPKYLTVGTGESQYADKLVSMLEDASDSGYGGSIADDILSAASSDAVSFPYTQNGSDGHAVASHIHQLHYNHNRTALARAISRTMDTLRKLQEVNRDWPAHYPTFQPAPSLPISPTNKRSSLDFRPGLHHSQSHRDEHTERARAPRPSLGARRAETTVGDVTAASHGESSAAAAQKVSPEPRLVTPQLARDFSVLKIDLKMEGVPQTEIIHTLRRDSRTLAQLLDGQIGKSLRHLYSLRERIEDTSSKVLVTGDLNAGKSTFVNALLRRKVLPEDEQPCTSIFCEVLDVRENGGIEEVHAIPNGARYDRNNESTYHVFPIRKLEQIVVDNDHYAQCKVYVKDVRSVDESLLNNGVLDIALIDAPGLNNDSLKTTAIFARQEEIDVVVFVVSAANHFTLSAREFIYDAAREKAYMFMVVNGFDNIKNKDRCQQQILKQVAHLSPATFKESSELVHFVSSAAVEVDGSGAPRDSHGPGGPANGGSSAIHGNGPSPPDGDDSPDPEDDTQSGKGKGKQKELARDFENLEASLRRFVLEKRARSKLAPARHYLLNVLEDLGSLATVNRDLAQSELDRVTSELTELEPVLDSSRRARTQASDDLDKLTEDAAANVYAFTRETLNTTIADVSQRNLGVAYEGFWTAYQYAQDIVAAMLQEISDTVGSCEDYARGKTGEGVNSIKSLGLLHLGDAYIDLNFHSEKMLRRKKDALARQIDVEIELTDFVDFSSLWNDEERFAGKSMAVSVAGMVGLRMVGGLGWVDGVLGAAKVLGSNGLRRLFVPGLLAGIALAISYAVAMIPQSLPRRLSYKLSEQLSAIDFTHSNALRISSEVRKALKIPSDNLRIGLQRNVEQLQNKREETNKTKIESEVARKYFSNLVRDSGEIRGAVDRVDLEGAIATNVNTEEPESL